MPGAYPDDVCADCAERRGWKTPDRTIQWRRGRCGLCGLDRPVTPMHSYGYPRIEFGIGKGNALHGDG